MPSYLSECFESGFQETFLHSWHIFYFKHLRIPLKLIIAKSPWRRKQRVPQKPRRNTFDYARASKRVTPTVKVWKFTDSTRVPNPSSKSPLLSLFLLSHLTVGRDVISRTEYNKMSDKWTRLRDFRVPLPCKWRLRPSGTLRDVYWYLVIDVSGQPVGPIFKGHAAVNYTPHAKTYNSRGYSFLNARN